VILPKGAAEDSFPVMQILRANSLDLSDYVDVTQCIEVSRFAISREFRQRTSSQVDSSLHPQPASRQTDLAFLSLLQFALRESLTRGLLFWTAVMEPKLLRLLARYGISYATIGPTVEHHGIRQSCYGYIPDTLDHVRRIRPDCWELLTQGVLHGSAASLPNESRFPRSRLAINDLGETSVEPPANPSSMV
jgi:N-acyl amino acid synthase of PEP-CTERM/exosortase system